MPDPYEHFQPADTVHPHVWKGLAACLLVGGALLWLFRSAASNRAFDWSLFSASFAHLRWEWLLLSLIPVAGSYYARALRWAVFMTPLKARPSMRNLLSSTLIGFAAITLFGRPGEFVRPYLIALRERLPLTSQIAIWFLERIFDLLMSLLLFGFALTRVHALGFHGGPKLAVVLAAGGQIVLWTSVAVLAAILASRHFAEPLRLRLNTVLHFLPEKQFRRLEKWMLAFVSGLESTRSDSALLMALFYSVVQWLLIAAYYGCLARSFAGAMPLGVLHILTFVGFISLGAIVQLPGIGGGIQVVAVIVLTELFGIRLEVASSFALLISICSFVSIVPAGLALAVKEGLNWRKLRHIAREDTQGSAEAAAIYDLPNSI